MPLLTQISGGILVATGPLAFFLAKHDTMGMLIPFLFGVALLSCGIMAKQNPEMRKLVMHVAVLLGPLGCIGAVWALNQEVVAPAFKELPSTADALKGLVVEASSHAKVEAITKTIMAIVCGQYFVLCFVSFLQARAARAASAAGGTPETAKP